MDKVFIELAKGQKIFFTSDPHYGHRNILTFCHRPFKDTKEMEKSLIENWNSVVGDNDIAFILGDVMWFEGRTECKKVLEQLKGKEIHIVPGNHDKLETFEYLSDRFIIHDSIVTCWVKTFNGTNQLFLCHFPMATWPHFEQQAVHLFGHIHSGQLSENRVDKIGEDLVVKEGKCYDVGCDNNNYTPIEVRDIYNKLGKTWK